MANTRKGSKPVVGARGRFLVRHIVVALRAENERLREALTPFAEIGLPERNGFTLYTREEILAARAALTRAGVQEDL